MRFHPELNLVPNKFLTCPILCQTRYFYCEEAMVLWQEKHFFRKILCNFLFFGKTLFGDTSICKIFPELVS